MTDPGSGDPQQGQPNPYNQPSPTEPPGYAAPPPPPYAQPYEPPGYQPPPPTYGQPYEQPGYPPQPAYQQPYPGYPATQPYAPVGYGQPTPPAGKSRKGWFIGGGVVVAAIIVAVVLLAVAGKRSGSSGTPADAAKNLMVAAKAGDKNGVLSALCSTDRAVASAGNVNPLTTIDDTDPVTSYQIGAVSQTDSTHADVKVTISYQGEPAPDTQELPVVKEGGSWKVCFSSSIFGGGTGGVSLPTSLPSGLLSSLASALPNLPTNLPTDLPTSIGSLCANQTNALIVAAGYIGLAEGGDATDAQSCVYKNSVPLATTQKLSGKELIPTGALDSSGTLTLTGGGSTVKVTTAKESDGNYYVTAVTIS